MDGKPTILVAEKLGEAGLKVLEEFANVDCSYNLSPEDLCTKISLCDALIVRSGTKVSRQVFESSAGRLKVVGRAGVGIDNVDLGAATEHGCLVVNAPTANTVAAAEHGIALLTAMARNIAQADASVKAGKWLRSKYVGVSLVADRARAIGVELLSFDEAIASADFISLHMPLVAATSKMLNDETFAKMKKGVRIINVARGGVIDEEALVKAIDAGIVAQAALDVFTEEPPAKDSKLVQSENVIATPHLGASTMEAQEGVAIEIAEAVVGALKGELAATAVNAPMVPAELVAGGSGVKSVKVTYASTRAPDDLDTRLLRAMITKGLIEPISNVLCEFGSFEVDVSLEGSIILCSQVDQPGMIGKVGSILGEENVNVSFMSVGRIAPRKQAVMAIGVDEEPSKKSLKRIGEVPAIEEFVYLNL
ncbi:UNVERIFIED_CONTAM: D-3-phosphoglycerate dehydrogenase 1, chloroplastic [Sesamum calycinum]|uniref:D-3-phosphoglycerate dehydrogenase n=1 Tax=Sesamum calycinum TaxID=2727403 RepID=A0AAW2PL25_9LAMI